MKYTISSALCLLGMAATAQAGIIYSGPLNQQVGINDPATVEINGYEWEFGILEGGPLEYAYISANNAGAGVFVELTDVYMARNFSEGANIGTLTSVLNMYPSGGGEVFNHTMHDYIDGSGQFDAPGSGYVAFGFGGGIDFNYGWMSFELTGDENPTITLTGWAYNDVVNGSITAGQMAAVPGPAAAAAAFGLFGIRRNRRRG